MEEEHYKDEYEYASRFYMTKKILRNRLKEDWGSMIKRIQGGGKNPKRYAYKAGEKPVPENLIKSKVGLGERLRQVFRPTVEKRRITP